MDSNTHSIRPADPLPALTAAVDGLAAQELHGLPDAVRAERVLQLRRLLDRLEGHWLNELAAVDAGGAAGAEEDVQAGSTAGWLRSRLRMGAAAASNAVRTARALFAGPLPRTGQALTHGDITPAHAAVLAHGTHDLPDHVTAEAEPVLVEAARRLDPARLRRVIGHLQLVADPDGAAGRAERRHRQRGLWLASTLDNMVAVDGLLEAEAGQILLAALEPLTRPHSAADPRSGGQRRADALAELARRTLEGGRLPQTGGVRPQLLVTVDLDSLQGRPGLGGDTDSGPLDPEACRRLACDGALTRVLVTRHPSDPHSHWDDNQSGGHHHPIAQPRSASAGVGAKEPSPAPDPPAPPGLAARLRAAAALLPPVLGGSPDPAAGGRPDQPGRHPHPTCCPGCPRPRLCVPRLRSAPGLVRGPPSAPLAPRRPHRPGQSGPGVPGPPPGGP